MTRKLSMFNLTFVASNPARQLMCSLGEEAQARPPSGQTAAGGESGEAHACCTPVHAAPTMERTAGLHARYAVHACGLTHDHTACAGVAHAPCCWNLEILSVPTVVSFLLSELPSFHRLLQL